MHQARGAHHSEVWFRHVAALAVRSARSLKQLEMKLLSDMIGEIGTVIKTALCLQLQRALERLLLRVLCDVMGEIGHVTKGSHVTYLRRDVGIGYAIDDYTC